MIAQNPGICRPALGTGARARLLGMLLITGLLAAACGSSRAPTTVLKSGEPAKAARIALTEEGIYRLTAADLQALGWEGVDPSRLRFSVGGQPQPLWVRGEGKEVEIFFYGQPADSRYTRENVYLLQPDAGPADWMAERPPVESVPGPVTSGTYLATVHVEENPLYYPRAIGDHTWFWIRLSAPKVETIEVVLPDAGPGAGVLRASFYGITDSFQMSPDHHLRLSINGILVADETWDGQGVYQITAAVPDGILKPGTNQVEIEAPGDTGVAVDASMLDWIEVDYPRPLQAAGDRLFFVSPGESASLAGFSGPVMVFDVADPGEIAVIPGVEAGMIFQTVVGRRYFAAGPRGFLAPAEILPANFSPDLKAPGLGADYIAIGPPDLLAAVQPLLDYRTSQGLASLSVPVEAVYDQFNYGLAEPEAIRAFLQFAVENWSPAPKYLLLVGDSTYDLRGFNVSPEANRLPSFFVHTTYGGETVSDIEFVKLDADPYPDMAVGRIPAATPDQVTTVVDKTLAYEQAAPAGDWQRLVLAIADGQDASFRDDAETFLDSFSDEFQPLLYAPEKGAADANVQIDGYLTEGVLFMSYFGHGSITQLGKDTLFSTKDAAALKNGDRLPIMLNLTCLAGLFTHPTVESLAETMLWNPEGGAVAALSATSLTLASDQSLLSKAFVEVLLENPGATLGEVLLGAQQKVPLDQTGPREVVETFLLFGDPALRLAGTTP